MKSEWIKERINGIHLTIRDVDCRDFDAALMARQFSEMHVEFFTFFAGGYITTYPTSLPFQRMSPYLDGKDITGDIIREAHRHDIKAVAMADLGPLPEHAAKAHPEWCAVNEEGKPHELVDRLHVACPMGGYIREYTKEIVGEIITRYDVDGIKFGGNSYGFGAYRTGICYCRNCRDDFKTYSGGLDIPRAKDLNRKIWKVFTRWKHDRAIQQVRHLRDVVASIDPDMPVFGNSTCFGDPQWTMRSSLDVEMMLDYQSAIQVEAQTRFKLEEDQVNWQSMQFPGEEARYMTSITDKPIWVVCSYFMAWPWRRNAAPPVEQKQYLAQIAANGAFPMVNLSGGPPAVHEDSRGFEVIGELYGFLKKHKGFILGTESEAKVAIVYSQDTLVYYGNDEAASKVVEPVRGLELALSEAHIPFDIISARHLRQEKLQKYLVLMLPNTACLSEDQAGELRAYVRQGGSLLATFETSLYDPDGEKRENFLLADLFQADYAGRTAHVDDPRDLLKQSYMRIKNHDHPLLNGLEQTSLLPAAGYCCDVLARKEADVPLTRSSSFRVYPEGSSYEVEPDGNEPMAICSSFGRGKVVYFPHQLDKWAWKAAYPDWNTLLINSVRWLSDNRHSEIIIEGPKTLDVSLRRKGPHRIVHLINLTGGRRLFTELVPLHHIRVGVKERADQPIMRAYRLSDGEALALRREDGFVLVNVDKLVDYDVIVFE